MNSNFGPPVMNTTGKRLYLNSKGEVVERGPDAKTLLAAPGLQVSPEHVEAYNAYAGVQTEQPDNNEPAPDAVQPVEPEAEGKALKAAPQNKAIEGPKEQK